MGTLAFASWADISVIIAVLTFINGIYLFMIKLIVDSSNNRLKLDIQQSFVTREEFNRHVDKCPIFNGHATITSTGK